MKKHLVGVASLFTALAACSTVAGVDFARPAFLPPGSVEEREFREYCRLTAAELPMNRADMRRVELRECVAAKGERVSSLSLDGGWTLAREGIAPIAYEVPESIHVALMRAGLIPDPNFGTNGVIGLRQASEYDWKAVREFDWDGAAPGERDELVFGGVCDRCEVVLNGERLGAHQGMYGGPDFDVTGKLKKGRNRVEVLLKRAIPFRQTVSIVIAYGLHYTQVVPLGIWRSVSIRRTGRARLDHPFVATRDAGKGEVSLFVATDGNCPGTRLEVEIAPKNFKGRAFGFDATLAKSETRFDFAIPEVRRWWPHGYGEQALYVLRTRLRSEKGDLLDSAESQFGVREFAFESSPAYPGDYRRNLSVNGKPIFRKGANWCTLDSLLRFSTAEYRRFLVRAKEQGVDYLRVWGNGMVETEEFYDLCDEMGFLVMQEYPTSCDSHYTQPADVLEETAARSAKRLRGRASLFLWNGGNETIVKPDDEKIFRRLGRGTYLNDGTRPYHRQEENRSDPANWAVCHAHIRWAGRYPEFYLERFGGHPVSLGEWGNDTMMNVESIVRTVGPAAAAEWPIDPDGAVAYRTAMFNHFNRIWHGQDATTLRHHTFTPSPITDKYTGQKIPDSDIGVAMEYTRTFYPDEAITNLATLVRGSQLAQAMATAPMIGNMRSFAPVCPGFSYYKLSDIGPCGSWALVDWYGAPKIAYWWAKAFMTPVLAAVRLPTFDFHSKPNADWKIPVRVLDERGELSAEAYARIRVFDDTLKVVADQRGDLAFDLGLNRAQIADGLRFILAEVVDRGRVVSRTWTPCNYDKVRGSLFRLPRTSLKVVKDADGRVVVTNRGTVPAVGVEISSCGHADGLHLSDNWFWLEPGETRAVTVRFEDGGRHPLTVEAFNARSVDDVGARARGGDGRSADRCRVSGYAPAGTYIVANTGEIVKAGTNDQYEIELPVEGVYCLKAMRNGYRELVRPWLVVPAPGPVDFVMWARRDPKFRLNHGDLGHPAQLLVTDSGAPVRGFDLAGTEVGSYPATPGYWHQKNRFLWTSGEYCFMSTGEVKIVETLDFPQLRKRGWYKGDFHAHVIHGENFYHANLQQMNFICRAEHYDWIGLSQEHSNDGYPCDSVKLAERLSDEKLFLWVNNEFPKNLIAHFGNIGVPPIGVKDYGPGYSEAKVTNLELAEKTVYARGGLCVPVHPLYGDVVRVDKATGRKRYGMINNELVLWLLCRPDLVPVVDFFYFPEVRAEKFWYKLLNRGYTLAASGTSDAAFDVGRSPGCDHATYAKLDRLDHPSLLKAFREGRTMVSYFGAGILFEIDGKTSGDKLVPGDGRHVLKVDAWADPGLRFAVEVIRNGEVFDRRELTAGADGHMGFERELVERENAWYVAVLRKSVRSPEMRAIASPIYFRGPDFRPPETIPFPKPFPEKLRERIKFLTPPEVDADAWYEEVKAALKEANRR